MKSETSAKLRPLVEIFVVLEFKSSKDSVYSCGLNPPAPRFRLKLLVSQGPQSIGQLLKKNEVL